MSPFANKARLLIDNDGKFARAALPRFGARARCADVPLTGVLGDEGGEGMGWFTFSFDPYNPSFD